MIGTGPLPPAWGPGHSDPPSHCPPSWGEAGGQHFLLPGGRVHPPPHPPGLLCLCHHPSPPPPHTAAGQRAVRVAQPPGGFPGSSWRAILFNGQARGPRESVLRVDKVRGGPREAGLWPGHDGCSPGAGKVVSPGPGQHLPSELGIYHPHGTLGPRAESLGPRQS